VDEAEDLEDAEEVEAEAVVQDLGVEAEDADHHFEAEDAAEVGGVVEVAAGGVVEAEVGDVAVAAEKGQPFKSIGTMAATLSRRVGMKI